MEKTYGRPAGRGPRCNAHLGDPCGDVGGPVVGKYVFSARSPANQKQIEMNDTFSGRLRYFELFETLMDKDIRRITCSSLLLHAGLLFGVMMHNFGHRFYRFCYDLNWHTTIVSPLWSSWEIPRSTGGGGRRIHPRQNPPP